MWSRSVESCPRDSGCSAPRSARRPDHVAGTSPGHLPGRFKGPNRLWIEASDRYTRAQGPETEQVSGRGLLFMQLHPRYPVVLEELGLDLRGEVPVLCKECLGVLPPLPQAGALVGEPGA